MILVFYKSKDMFFLKKKRRKQGRLLILLQFESQGTSYLLDKADASLRWNCMADAALFVRYEGR